MQTLSKEIVIVGVYCLKHHLDGTQRDVDTYMVSLDEFKKEMLKTFASLQERFIKKTNT